MEWDTEGRAIIPILQLREQAQGSEQSAPGLTAGVIGRARQSWTFVLQLALLFWPPLLLKGRLRELLPDVA